jgi:hypothetical protein
MEGQSNITVLADMDHHIPCQPEYTNLLSNTNLFSIAEQEKIKEVTLKYQNVTTNSGPAGTVFKGWELRRRRYVDLGLPTNTFSVACFSYTNSDAREQIDASGDAKHIIAKFRTPTGDGYDVAIVDNILMSYQEYKNELPDGLFVVVQDPKLEHCGMWARFTKGKVLGKFIVWQMNDQSGFQIMAEAEFKDPFDFLKYQSIPIDFAWDEVSTNSSN